MPKRDPSRKTISIRVAKTTAERMRTFLRDYSGKPLYLKPGEFAEKAILREIQRLEMILSGALPMDDEERTSPPVRIRKPVSGKLMRTNSARSPLLSRGDDDHGR